ncbi:MAG: hypothetical protein AAFU85_26020 [Planctomycetota bacterium]
MIFQIRLVPMAAMCLLIAMLALQGSAAEPRPCVLLTNGNVIFGEAVPLGETISIRQAESQLRLPRTKVVAWADSIEQLYARLRKERIPGDLRRIHDDIRWCLRYGLVREAAEDALLANELDPKGPSTQQLLRVVAHQLRAQQKALMAKMGDVRQVSHQEDSRFELPDTDPTPEATMPSSSGPLERDLATHSIDQTSIHRFTTRVQPILLSRCSGCHSKESSTDTAFDLVLPRSAKWAPKRAAEKNLVAVLKFVDLHDPLASEIRRRAIDGHGGRRKTLNDSTGAMLGNFDQWLGGLVVESKSFTDEASLRPGPPPPLAPWRDADGAPGRDAAREPDRDAPSKPRRIPQVENPFDPAIFNRRFHGTGP